MSSYTLKLHHFISVHQKIKPYIKHTPLIKSKFLSEVCQAHVWLKLDFLQPTGSFKVRGALNKLMTMTSTELAQGVVTASAGNHGLGLAYATETLNTTTATIFVPETAPKTKIEKLKRYPISLRQTGLTYTETHHTAEDFATKTGSHYISAYNDIDLIMGQGTCGLEIMSELPQTDIILVPTGGGGLLSGVALVAKAINPLTKIIGVQPQASPAAKLSFEQGNPIDPYDPEPTLADGLAGGFGNIPFYLARTLIDQILLHSEDDLKKAVFNLIHQEQLLVEPSAAIAIAPLLQKTLSTKAQTIVCILTGSNIDSDLLTTILNTQV